MKRLTRLSLFAAAVILLAQCTPAQEEKAEPEATTYSFAEGHAKVWAEAVAQIEELADAMPEDQWNYTPHDSSRTFAEQLLHIGGSSKIIANLYLKDIPPPQDRPEMNAEEMSKEEIMTFVTTQLTETGEIMAAMSDQQLMENIKSFGGNDFSRLEGLLTIHDHLTNHKAKANLYVRISGNTPPSYRYY